MLHAKRLDSQIVDHLEVLLVGLLTADAIYTLTGDYAANRNAKLLDFVAKKVLITGEVTEKDGVKSIKLAS